ncbi:MAG TPA: hypothetical protein PLL10_04240 [Elusimicrobiales bacterium]|nr:hypothetical protein [Elusimicrobiales bacterium]
MQDNGIFEEKVRDTADKIAGLLRAEGKISSWEIKTRLHLSSSLLYIALGRLQERGLAQLEPDQLNYLVKSAQN